jgi:hypothetical protein
MATFPASASLAFTIHQAGKLFLIGLRLDGRPLHHGLSEEETMTLPSVIELCTWTGFHWRALTDYGNALIANRRGCARNLA